MTPPRSVSTLPPPSTLANCADRAAWVWYLVGVGGATRADADEIELSAWWVLGDLLRSVTAAVVTAETRAAGDAVVRAIINRAPWQRGQCARSAWACASRASRRSGHWPRTAPLADMGASHRLTPWVARDLAASLYGDQVGAAIFTEACLVTGFC